MHKQCKHQYIDATWYGNDIENDYMVVWRCRHCHAIVSITFRGTNSPTMVSMSGTRGVHGTPNEGGRLNTEAVITMRPQGVSYEAGWYSRNDA